jgi:hypothetical protein
MSSAWQSIDLSKVNPNLEIVPAGTYTFSLSGAKYGFNDPNRIEATATIVSEGEFAGRKLFFSYPDPSRPKCDWSPKALKRLMQAIGEDPTEGEDPVAYLNRIAGSHFNASVRHTKPTDEYPNPRAELNVFNVSPAG